MTETTSAAAIRDRRTSRGSASAMSSLADFSEDVAAGGAAHPSGAARLAARRWGDRAGPRAKRGGRPAGVDLQAAAERGVQDVLEPPRQPSISAASPVAGGTKPACPAGRERRASWAETRTSGAPASSA